MTFLLTGSSARKLRKGGANLLAGRAWQAELFPLTSQEIPNFDLMTYLNHGGLPQVYGSRHAKEELHSYVSTYLQEEIHVEAVTRNISAFAEFLDIIAISNGKEINFESLASDCQVSASTIKNYISILEDTLLGFMIPGFLKTKKRKAISRGKFFLFDIGVTIQTKEKQRMG
jgi:predicted AAA+ superfamily ATPase